MRAIEDEDLKRLLTKSAAFDMMQMYGKDYLLLPSISAMIEEMVTLNMSNYQKIAYRKKENK